MLAKISEIFFGPSIQNLWKTPLFYGFSMAFPCFVPWFSMGFSRENPHFFLPSAPPRLATPRPLSATSRRHHGPERPQRDPPEAGGTLQHTGDDQLRALAGRLEGWPAAETGFSAAAFRDRAAIGRNLAIELLEFFDARGLTRREGATRRLVASVAQVFGEPGP